MESLVFGKKDPKVQELISAVIVLKPNIKVMYNSGRHFHLSCLVMWCVLVLSKKLNNLLYFPEEATRTRAMDAFREKKIFTSFENIS